MMGLERFMYIKVGRKIAEISVENFWCKKMGICGKK